MISCENRLSTAPTLSPTPPWPCHPLQTFVVFPSADSDSNCSSESHGPEAADTTDDFRPPPSIVRLTPKAELVAEYRARFFSQSPATEAADKGSDKDADGSRNPGTDAISRDVELVVRERALQRRVRIERARLATKVYLRRFDNCCGVRLLSRHPAYLINMQKAIHSAHTLGGARYIEKY